MKFHDIYDRIFKRLFDLSVLAIINLINGLFETDYPLNSTVEYSNREFVNSSLGKRYADTFITINGIYTYHI
ncbi:MAG: hypothetical protein PHP50_02005 [Lachnospiraceae bacterium]|nr:hypothetical protein [Lachnospiraceae bacterium]